MDVTLSLDPDVEKGLLARAHARGVSLGDYLQEIVARGGRSEFRDPSIHVSLLCPSRLPTRQPAPTPKL